MVVIQRLKNRFRGVLRNGKIRLILICLFWIGNLDARTVNAGSVPVDFKLVGSIVDKSSINSENTLATNPGAPVATVTSVTGATPLCIGATATYSANGVVLDGGTGAWSSSNAAIATVNAATGLVTAVSAGACDIIYTITGGVGGTVFAQQLLTVNPFPVLSSSLNPPAICNNSFFSYIPTSSTVGTTFSWTRAAVGGISNAPASGTGNPNEPLNNTTSSPVSVTYIYTLSANGCTNPTTYNVVVQVNPTPVLTSSVSPPATCSGLVFSYTPTSSTSGVTFSWSRAAVPGISNISSSGTNSPNESLINTTTSPVNVVYVYTLNAAGCTSTYNVTAVINPAATLSSTLSPPAICSGSVFSYTPASLTAGATFAWSRSTVAGISNASASGTGNPNETLVNTSANPVSVTYIFSVTANGCTNPITFIVVVSVNPDPVLTSSLSPPAICNNSFFIYTPTSSTPGSTFSWTRAVVAGVSNGASSGTGTINEPLNNTTAGPVNVTYVYTLSANGCTNPVTFNVVLQVNPAPVLTSGLTPPPICSGTVLSYTPTSSMAGTTFSWSRAAVAGISNTAASGTNDPNEVLTNTTPAPVNVVYVYTLNSGSCTSSTNVTVVVNPAPALSSTLTPPAVCSGTVFIYNPTSITAGATFAWSRSSVAGISNPASSGTGNPNETLVNTTNLPVSVTYNYTVTANGCTNPVTYNVVVTVNPASVLTSSTSPPAICSNSFFSYTPLSSTPGTTFLWNRAVVPGISNALASGTGNPNEPLVNTTSSPVSVTYAYTLSANGCTNPTTYNVVVVVNPTPVLTSSLTPPSICTGTAFNYTPTSSTVGTSFSWNRAPVVGISNTPAGGTGDPNEVLINTTAFPLTVIYDYTLTANGCTNSQNVSVIVNPTPVLTSNLTPPSICSGTVFSYNPSSLTTGVNFSWNRAAVVGISNLASVGTGNPNEILTNTTYDPVSVIYVYTLTANGCTNIQNVSVIVNPTPTLSSSLTPPGICSGGVFSYIPASASVGVTFNWTRAVVAGISNAASSGSGNPLENLVNTTTSPINVTYSYSLAGNGCINNQNVVVIVNPLPTLSSTLTPPAICSNTSFSYNPTSANGTVTGWTRAAVPGISNTAGSGAGNPNETLINTSNAAVSVTYVYTLSAPGCSNTQNVVVSVNPTPTLTSSLSPPGICSSTPFSYVPTGNVVGAVYSWNRAAVAGISNATASGTSNPNETLINTTLLPVTVTYIYTVSISGCANPTTYNVNVSVIPSSILTSTLTPLAICSSTNFTYNPTTSLPGTTVSWSRNVIPGISNAAASGSNGISETLINNSPLPVNVTYVYTLVYGGCTNVQNVVVTVNPTPALSTSLTPPAICSNTAFNYPAASLTPGTTINWTRSAVPGISNPASSGSGNPNETLINTTALPVVVTYAYTLNANGCSNVQNVNVTVNPVPGLTSSLSPPSICSNGLFGYVPTSSSPGVTFGWNRPAIAGISNLAATGTDNPNEILVNTSNAPIAVTYIYTLSIGACSRIQNVVVIVNPVPVLSGTLTPPAICNNSNFSYVPASAVGGTTFNWSRAAVPGIGNAPASGTGNPNETLVNTTNSPVNVTYVYTLSANGCTNVQNVVVSVNPTPILTSSLTPPDICSSSVFNYIPLSLTPGTFFSWTRAAVAGISNLPASGTGNITEILVNTTALPVTVTYIFTLSINGCSNPSTYSVNVNVIPSSVLTSPMGPISICSNSIFTYNHTESLPGTTVSWSRAFIPGISNATNSGSGNPAEILYNTTTSTINVPYVFTLTYDGCTNIQNVNVSVEPLPVLSSTLTPSDICNNTSFDYLPASATSGTTFNWRRPVVTGISNPTASGTNNPQEILVNTTADPINVTYIYTLSANGCSNVQNVVVRVNPTPVLTSSLTAPSICSNSVFSYIPTSSASGVTFNWSRAAVPGISNAATFGINNPSETLINTSTLPVTVTYLYTLSSNGCTNPTTYSVTVVVNPYPALTSSLSPPAICSNTVFSYTPTSSTPGASFNWSRAVVPGISNASASGTFNPNETLGNTTAAPIAVTYVYTVLVGGCANPTTYNVVVTVNPTPTLTSSLTPPDVCSGSVFSYSPTSLTAGVTFGWTRAVVAGISNAFGSGTDNPNETLVNTTPLPIVVTYVYTLSSNGCINSTTYSVNVNVNPLPTLTSGFVAPAICSGTTFSYSPTASATGTTFAWSRAAVAGISNAPANSTGNVNETLVNTTGSPVVVTYVYTLGANGCSNTQNVTVTVNPTLTLSSTLTPPAICSGSIFSYIPSSLTPGTTFNWSRALVAGISNASGSGLGNPNETLTNTSALPVVVTYAYNLSANGCSNVLNVTVRVNPTPVLTSTLTPAAICNNTVFSYVPTSSTPGTIFSWSRAAVLGISNALGSGTGNPNETLVNTTGSPVTVTYLYTVSANGCTNPSTYSVVVVVNPSPVLSSSLTPPAICSGNIFSYAPTSTTAGITYSWSRATVAGISNPASSGNGNIGEILVNASTVPINVTYVYSLGIGGCTNPQNVVITVSPTAILTSNLTAPVVCSGSVFSYTPTSSTPGTLFSWTRAVVVGISNGFNSGTGNPNETLVNTTAVPIVVTYVYSLSINGCANPSTYSVTVTVNPYPTLSSGLSPPAICSGTSFSYTPTSPASGTVFSWSRAAVAGISNASTSGTGNPNETLFNTTTSPVTVTYAYSLSANGCTNPSIYNVQVVVNPTMTLSSTFTPPAICSGSVFSYVPTSPTPGVTFNWSRAAVVGISNVAGSGTGNPNETLTNTSALPIVVTYTYTLGSGGCTNSYNVLVTVNPTPVLTSSLTPAAICSNSVFSYSPMSSTPGAIFSWSRSAVAGISNSANTGINNPNEILVNTTSSPISVSYVYSLSANGCTNPSTFTVAVTVDPAPSLSSSLAPPAICSGNLFNYTPASTIAGAVMTWRRASVPGIIQTSSSGSGSISEFLTNSSAAPVYVIYQYTLLASGCTNIQDVVVTVNPTPVLTSSLAAPPICSGTNFQYAATSATAGTIFSWTRAGIPGILQPASVGVGDINEVLTNTTNAPVVVTYGYTLTANGCPGISYNVTVTVNPTPPIPVITPPGPVSFCAGGNVILSAPAGYSSYLWSNGASSQNIIVTTTGSYSVVVKDANGCQSASSTPVATSILPIATAFAGSNGLICAGTNFNITGATATNYSSFVWNTSGTGTFINGTTLSPIYLPSVSDQNTGVVTLTLTAYSIPPCVTTVQDNLILTIRPLPTVNAGVDKNLCYPATLFVSGAIATNYQNPSWTHNGTGTLTGNFTLTPTYHPGLADVGNTVKLTLSVDALAPCATTVSDFMLIQVDALPGNPGAISGPAGSRCKGTTATYSVLPIPQAVNYNWSLPSGISIVSGANSNTVNVLFGPGAVSGNITVYGSNSCGNGLVSTLPVVVSDIPANPGSISGSTAICQGSTGLIFSVTPVNGATGYTWTVPSGATITSVPPLTNSITVDFGMASMNGNVTVYASNGCGNGPVSSKAVQVNIKPATPVITASGNPTTFCEGGNILLSGPTNGFNYLWSPGGATTQTNVVTTTGNYSVVVTDPATGCSSAASNIISITVNPAPAAPASTGFITQCWNNVGPAPLLDASTVTSSAAGTTIKWYDAPVAGNVVVLPILNAAGTVTYYAEASNNVTGCKSLNRTPVVLTISNNPPAPIAIPSTPTCESPGLILTATATTVAGTTILWYTTPTGGLPVSPTLSIPGTKTFYAEASNGFCTSLTRSAAVTLTILPAPAAPVSGGDITRCLDIPAVIYTAIATAPAGSTVVWYDFPSGGAPVSPTWSSLGSKTFYAESKNSTTLCASLVRIPVTINIISHPAPPAFAPNVIECERSPLQTLTFTAPVPPGSTVKWYNNVAGGLPLATAPTLHAIGTATYYASTDNGVCESSTRTAVTMQINPAPPAPFSLGDKTICETTPPTTLKADDQIGAQGPGISLKWYMSSSGGTEVANATLGNVGTITYYAEAYQVATGCASLNRSTPVKLTINDSPDQPVTNLAIQEACQTSAGVTLTATATATGGATVQWYTAATGGTLVPSPTLSAPGTVTLWAEALLGNCTSPSPRTTSVKLTIDPNPAPPSVTNPPPKCDDGTPMAVSASVPSGIEVIWFDTATGGSPVTPTPSLTGPGKIIYYAEARNIATDCRSLSRTSQTLEIKAAPADPVADSDITVCATSPVQTITASATSPDGSPVKWYRTATGGSPVTPNLSVIGTVTFYAEADNGSCKSKNRSGQTLTIYPVPLPPKGKPELKLCSDDPRVATDNFNSQVIPAGSAGIEWFSTSTGGEPLDHIPTFSELVPGTTVFYAGSKDNVTVCQSLTRTAATVTINPQPLDPVSAGDVTACVQSPVQVLRATVLTPVDGATIVWYTTATGNTTVASPVLNHIGTISYWAEAKLGTCISANRAMVTLTINPVPAAPTVGASGNHLTACESAAGLDANAAINIVPGTTIKWYDSATNGIEVSPIQTTPGDRILFAEASYSTGCKSPTRTRVLLTVDPNPADPVGIDLIECANTPVQTITAQVVTPPAGVTITWYDAPTGGSIVPSPTWDQIGTKPYFASASLGSCISANRAQSVLTIHDRPTAPVSTGDIIECESSLPVNANSAINNPDPSITIKWFDQPTNGFEVASPVITFVGTKTYYAEARNSSDCPSATRTAVKMTIQKTPPTPVKKGDISECEKTPLQTLDANTAIIPVAGWTLVWYDDTGVILTGSPTLNKVGTVTYLAAYQESSVKHCESPRTPIKLTISTPPKATAYSNTPLTLGSDLHLNGGPKGTDFTYLWTAPGGLTYAPLDGNVTIPGVIASDAGTYKLTVTSISTGCATTVTTQVVIFSASAGYQQVCMGGTLVLTGWPDNMKSYDWSGPDGFTSSLQNPFIDNVTAKNEGVYTLTVTDSKGIQSIGTVNVIINPLPEPFAQANTPVCQSGTLQLTGGPDDMLSYSWSGPNGYNSILQNPLPIKTPVPGNYVLTVVDKVNHCAAKDTILVEILRPVASADPICLGNTLRLKAAPSGMSSYKWTGPAGFTSNLQFPTIQNVTTANLGDYFLTITDNTGCTPPAVSTTVTLGNPPNASITISPNVNPICEGSDVVFMGGPTGTTETYTYEWKGPNGFSSVDQNPPVITNIRSVNSGLYTLTVTNSAGCSSTAQLNLNVSAVKFNGTYGPYCVNDSKVALSVSPAGVVLSGTGISGNSTSGYTFDPAVANIGVHPIAYTYTNGICSIRNSFNIEVVGSPKVVTNTVVLKSCSGVTADLTLPPVTAGSTAGLIFTYWSDAKATTAVTTPTAVGSGLYFIKGATASGKCWDIQSVTVGQPDSLRASILASPQLNCPGDSTGTLTVNITLGTAPFNYQWSTTPLQSTATAAGLRAGLYTVVVTDAKMCSAAFTGEITEPAPIKVGFAKKSIQCLSDANGSARVDTINGSTDVAQLNSYKYLWNTPLPQTTREAVRLTALWHKVTLTSSSGCIQNDSVFINVDDVTPPTITCPKDIELTVQYIKSVDPNKYTVDLGKPFTYDNCAIDTVFNDSPAKFRTGLTKVVWTVTDQMGLMDTCTQRIFIKEIPTVPQLISPNGDGVNDKFVIDGLTSKNYENTQLLIFTRSGQLVFQSNNYELPENAWDGRYSESNFAKNQLVAPGVYYYILKLGGSSSQTMKGYLYVYY
ncbi:MAG: gliding motility-associated C-terminal domain-containing protein [Prolixibacteraceae bacterium]|jgi:gliding motility-associated-like protein|nr:gliding motility-associated C-terminal domain-containing protein [Prolixibacteraceae bacterium]